MKTRSSILLRLMAAAAFCAGSSVAADFQVVASKDVAADSISADELKRIFMLSKNSIGAAKVTPVVQKAGPAHDAILKECLGMSGDELQNHYKALVFTGKATAPKAVSSDAEVISFVAMSKNAVGYVSATAITMGVKKLAVK